MVGYATTVGLPVHGFALPAVVMRIIEAVRLRRALCSTSASPSWIAVMDASTLAVTWSRTAIRSWSSGAP